MEYLTKVELLFESNLDGEISALDLYEAVVERFKEPIKFLLSSTYDELRLVEVRDAGLVVRMRTDVAAG